MDCEGCEYDYVIPEKDEILRQFDEMIIKFHDGPKKLKIRLDKAGLNVKVKKILYADRN